MGVTIHFEGQLKDEAAFDAVILEAKKLAEENKFPLKSISEREVTLQRVRNEEDWDYVGPVKGVEIQPHENSEPLRLEFDKDLYIQEYIKTQFAPVETHILVSDFLKRISHHFAKLEVTDEGEYFDSGDKSILEAHRNRFFEALDKYLVQESKYVGPVVLPSGRIIDVMDR